jgi:hypothetical protein
MEDELGEIIRNLFSRKLPGELGDIIKDTCFYFCFVTGW